MWKLKRVNPWTMDNLNLAIKDLDKGNSRDALGYANLLLTEDVAGTDLKLSTLRFMNQIKRAEVPTHTRRMEYNLIV